MDYKSPFRFRSDKGFRVEANPRGTTIVRLGRRREKLWIAILLPIVVPLPYLCFTGLLTIGEEVWNTENGGNIAEMFTLVAFTLLFVGAGLFVFCLMVWECVQELFPRTLLVDNRSGECSVGSVPMLRSRFSLERIEGIEIIASKFKRSPVCYLVLRLRRRRTTLRLMELHGHFEAPPAELAEAVYPFAHTISKCLADAKVSTRTVSFLYTMSSVRSL